MTISGVPNIRVIIREADDENLLVDVPNLTVRVLQDDSYNVNVTPPVVVSMRTGSYNRFADVALLANTASFAITSSYAENAGASFPFSGSAVITGSLAVQGQISASAFSGSLDHKIVTQSVAFPIPFFSQSFLATDTARHLTFNPDAHVLQISGSTGSNGGVTQITPRGISFTSGSAHSGVLNTFGIFTTIESQSIGLVSFPSKTSDVFTQLQNIDNPGIVIFSGSALDTAYIPLEFQGSASHTDGRVTVNTPLVAKQGIQVTGSVEAPDGFTGSLYGTASVADGIDVVIAGIYETGSDGVIIPAPSGGYTYISTASYALTASYIANNTWGNLLNIPTGLLSSSVQVYPLPVESSSYALTASYAMNGGGGSGSSGTSGTAGSSGTSGTTGSSGTSGSSGTAGSSGTSGETPSIPTGTVSSSVQLTALGFVSSSTINTIQTITSASYAGITPVSGTLYIIID